MSSPQIYNISKGLEETGSSVQVCSEQYINGATQFKFKALSAIVASREGLVVVGVRMVWKTVSKECELC